MNQTEAIRSCEASIRKIINHYAKYCEYEDLYQVATIGIMKAYDNYKPNPDVKFSTYAYKYILGEVIKYVNYNKGLKISQEHILIGRKIKEAQTILTQKLSKIPSSKELAHFLELDEKLVNEALQAHQQLESLDRTICEDGKTLYLQDTIADYRQDPNHELQRMMLNEAMKNLTKEEQDIIQMRFFQDKTQEETAIILGTNQAQVSRGLKRSLTKLRSNMTINS